MKPAAEPELNVLANELKTLIWHAPLTFEQIEEAREATIDVPEPASPSGHAHPKRRLVHPMPGFTHWTVRIYLGGAQRAIGIVKTADVANAMRFADMAQEYFWKYRMRSAAPPTNIDLNFDRDQVEADMTNEEYAVDLLSRIESYLIRTGALKTVEQIRKEQAEHRAQHKRGSLRESTRTGLLNIEGRLLEIEERMDGQDGWLKTLEEHLAGLDGRLKTLEDKLDSVLAILERPPVFLPGTYQPPPPPNELPYTPPPSPGWPVPSGPTCTPNPTVTC